MLFASTLCKYDLRKANSFVFGPGCDKCVCKVFSVVVCSILLSWYFVRCFVTMVVCIAARLVFMSLFCNGIWVCADICLICDACNSRRKSCLSPRDGDPITKCSFICLSLNNNKN